MNGNFMVLLFVLLSCINCGGGSKGQIKATKEDLLNICPTKPSLAYTFTTSLNTMVEGYMCEYNTLEIEYKNNRIIRASLKYNQQDLINGSQEKESFSSNIERFFASTSGLNIKKQEDLGKQLGLSDIYSRGMNIYNSVEYNGILHRTVVLAHVLLFDVFAPEAVPSAQLDEQSYAKAKAIEFNKMNWDVSRGDIEAASAEKYIEDSYARNRLLFNKDLIFPKAEVMYEFEDDYSISKLSTVAFHWWERSYVNKMQIFDDYTILKQRITAAYGVGHDEILCHNGTTYNTYPADQHKGIEEIHKAALDGQLQLVTYWATKSTVIKSGVSQNFLFANFNTMQEWESQYK